MSIEEKTGQALSNNGLATRVGAMLRGMRVVDLSPTL
jgi:hypothetical protein